MFTIDQGPAWIVAIAAVTNVYLTHRNGKQSAQRGTETKKQLSDLHQSTNGLSERNEAIARKLGVAEGKATGLEQGRSEEKK
jgi:hypothetical protein